MQSLKLYSEEIKIREQFLLSQKWIKAKPDTIVKISYGMRAV